MTEPPVHKAVPVSETDHHCQVCGQRVRRVPGGQGPTWVHADSGAVAAPNPPEGGPR